MSVSGSGSDKFFGAVLSNPPYQLDTGNGAVAVYQSFMESAKVVASKVSMVYPMKWALGGRGYKLIDFRKSELNSKHYSDYVVFSEQNTVFKDALIRGGVNFFLWNENESDSMNYSYDGVSEVRESLGNGFPVFLIDPEYAGIVKKVLSPALDVSFITSYGKHLFSDFQIEALPVDNNGIKIYYSGKGGGLKERMISRCSTERNPDGWKIITGKTADGFRGSLRRQNRMFIGKPGEITSGSFMQIGDFKTEDEAVNLMRFLKTDIVGFVYGVVTITQHANKGTYALVPHINPATGELSGRDAKLDFSKPETLDDQLAEIYGITDEERKFISSNLRPWKGKIDVDDDR